MEISTKQSNINRFDDEGLAAALAGDTCIDGPCGGGIDGKWVPEKAACVKLEPKVNK